MAVGTCAVSAERTAALCLRQRIGRRVCPWMSICRGAAQSCRNNSCLADIARTGAAARARRPNRGRRQCLSCYRRIRAVVSRTCVGLPTIQYIGAVANRPRGCRRRGGERLGPAARRDRPDAAHRARRSGNSRALHAGGALVDEFRLVPAALAVWLCSPTRSRRSGWLVARHCPLSARSVCMAFRMATPS